MNSSHVFLYKHVKTREPLMKCSILEARGSCKDARSKEREVLFAGPGTLQLVSFPIIRDAASAQNQMRLGGHWDQELLLAGKGTELQTE